MAVLFALIASLILFGLVDLLTPVGWVDQDYGWEVPLEVSWGALFTFFRAGSYVWVARFPHAPSPAFVQLGISGLALLISAGAGADWRPLGLALGTAVSGLALWLWAGRQPVPLVGRPSIAWGHGGRGPAGVPALVPVLSGRFHGLTSRRARQHHPRRGPLAGAGRRRGGPRAGLPRAGALGRRSMGSILWGVCGTLWGLLVALVTVPRRGPATH
jgi:hypothetical protein